MIHAEPHPLAGKTVMINTNAPQGAVTAGVEYRVEDWWDRITGRPWGDSNGNPACLRYAIRAGLGGLPADDEVLYGKIGAFGHLVHVSEIGEPL